ILYSFFILLLSIGCQKEDSGSKIDLVLEKTSVNLKPDSSTQILIQQGNGNYTVTSSNDSIVTAGISGDTVIISAGSYYANANAFIVVTDKYYKRSVISVSISSSRKELALNKDSVLISEQ